MFLFDDVILSPPEAVEYIEERVGNTDTLKSEVIGYFFEWFFLQPREEQVKVLKRFRDGSKSPLAVFEGFGRFM